ncbi:general stress protein [Sporosarcina siberiensis]|uniref:General stress protein n=1 Tax=Sporosarcina siberiensis TaxID=1365606 RepID=A0ABW4SJ19_9BACL
MADKKIIGTYQSEHEVLDKIDELRVQGFSENDIYVVTSDTDSLSMVRGRTDVDLKSSEGTWMDRFIAFISGDEPVKAAFSNMGFTEEESDRFYNEVKRGRILLYVDRDYNHVAYSHDSEIVNEHLDANVGSNSTVDYSGNSKNIYADIDATIEQEDRLRMQEGRLMGNNEQIQAGEGNSEKPIIAEQPIMEVPVSFDEVNMESQPVHNDAEDIPKMEDEIEITEHTALNEDHIVGKHEKFDPELERERLLAKSLIDPNRLL